MAHETIARRWARAVFDLGKESNGLAALNRDIGAFVEARAGSAELADVLDNPLVPAAAREVIAADVAARLGLSETAKGMLRLLARKRRMTVLPEIARQLARLTDTDAGIVRAEVVSAGDLSPAYIDKLRAELEKATGKKVAIAQSTDPALIAGVVTKIGDRVIDGSLRARLASFRDALGRT